MRKINEFEKNIIHNSLLKTIPNLINILEENRFIFLILLKKNNKDIKYPQIFLVSNSIIRIIKNTKAIRNINSVGLYFGFIKKNNFNLSIEGADFLEKLGFISKNKIILVNDVGERSVLYGNDIQKKMILKSPEKFKEGDLVFVYNQSKELISISLFQINQIKLSIFPERGIIAKNIIDKGYYLRMKQ